MHTDTCACIKLLYNNMSFVSVLGLEVYGNLNRLFLNLNFNRLFFFFFLMGLETFL